MSTVAEAVSARPENQNTPDKIKESLTRAQHIVMKMTADPDFDRNLIAQGIKPDAFDNPRYWHAVASYSHAAVERLRAKGGNPLLLSAVDLMAATPSAVLVLAHLDTDPSASNESDTMTRISEYNDKLRNFATDYPETRVADITTALLNITNASIEDRSVRSSASDRLRKVIRGAQHEAGYGTILQLTGREFEPSNSHDDQNGVDYLVGGNQRPLRIDVKASLHDMEKQGTDPKPYIFRTNGTIAMYSLIRDEEFGGRLGLPLDVAATKAPVLDELLSHAAAGRADYVVGSTLLRNVV